MVRKTAGADAVPGPRPIRVYGNDTPDGARVSCGGAVCRGGRVSSARRRPATLAGCPTWRVARGISRKGRRAFILAQLVLGGLSLVRKTNTEILAFGQNDEQEQTTTNAGILRCAQNDDSWGCAQGQGQNDNSFQNDNFSWLKIGGTNDGSDDAGLLLGRAEARKEGA